MRERINVEKLKALISNDDLFNKLLFFTEKITKEDFELLKTKIPVDLAQKLINENKIKNQFILKIANPHSFIIK